MQQPYFLLSSGTLIFVSKCTETSQIKGRWIQRSFQKTLKLVSVSTDKSRQSMGEQFLGEEEMGKVKTIYDRFMTSNIPVTQIETSCAWNLRKSYYIVNRFRLNIWEVEMKEYSMEPSRAGQNTLVWDELTSKRIIKRAH